MTVKLIVLATTCLFFSIQSSAKQDQAETAKEPPSSQILCSKTGEQVDIKQLAAELSHNEVIFLGEQHDNDAGHEFQFNVIQALVNQGLDVVISTEQFERDVQGVVDDYLAGRVSEEQFLASSRPWKNYAEHYRPIIEFAKKKRLPVLAANVPRELASKVSKGEAVNADQRVFLPRTTTAPENDYWQHFINKMKGHMGVDATDKLKSFYASQCVKDDAMAESITDFIAKNHHRAKTIVHLCGHFHSDFGLGTAARVVQRDPLLRIAVITMETIPESGKLDMESAGKRGHYVFWTVANKPK